MPHSRRYFVSNNSYAVTFRMKRGLPLVATNYMKVLLGGILARAQRDKKVTLCHFLWMGNHPHMLVICRDAEELELFYSEVQKKITDTIKRLLLKDHLELWEGRPVVARIGDLESAINQIVYIYANPSRANLVESIEEYPGYSTYSHSKNASTEVDVCYSSNECWVPPSKVPLLPEPSMRLHKDLEFMKKLKILGITQELELFPNAWMRCFDITEPEEVAEINQKIVERLNGVEEEYKAQRVRDKRGVLGERALRTQSILKDHTPAKSERRIFIICSDKEDRISFIEEFKAICAICRQCYIALRSGLSCIWPPGVFRPSLRPVASAI